MEENKEEVVLQEEVEEKVYTEKELISEVDRRVNQALQKQERKYNEKIKESEKLARMNEAEKYAYALEQREKAIEEKEKALTLAENKNEASKILADKGLSLQLVDFVVAEDADSMKANIDLLDKAFKASVRAEVEKRIASTAPKKNFIDPDAMTKERFNSLSIIEQQKLINDNPDLMNLIK